MSRAKTLATPGMSKQVRQLAGFRGRADDQTGTAGLTQEDLAAAANMPLFYPGTGSDEEQDQDQDQIPIPKKSIGTTLKSSKKKNERAEEKIDTEYKRASEHPDMKDKSRKRGTTEVPIESVSSPKKVHTPCTIQMRFHADSHRLDSRIFLLVKPKMKVIWTTSAPSLPIFKTKTSSIFK